MRRPRAKPNSHLSACGARVGRGAVLSSHSRQGESPSPRPSPLKGRGRRAVPRAPKTKREPTFPPAPRCRQPLACPSGRRARRGGGKHGPATGKGMRNPAFQRSLSVRWPVTGTGRLRRAAFPPRCPCDPFAPCGTPASRSGHRSARSLRVVSLDHLASVPSPEGFKFRRGCGCLFPTLPEGSAAPLQPAPPGPKTGFASGLPVWSRRPRALVPSLPPVIPGTRPWDAIGRLSVSFPQSRCEHRLHGLPGWRPRPVPYGFPKAPIRFEP